MKKLFTLLLCCLIVSGIVTAQGGKSVFLEIGGNGLGFSANFDTRVTKKEKGLGFRAGIGFFPGVSAGDSSVTIFKWPTILSIPVGLNYLAGKGPHYFEAGLGATYLYAKGHFTFFFFGTDQILSTIVFIPSVGYRYSKPGKGFQFRGIISPYIFSGSATVYGGFSFGYCFRGKRTGVRDAHD
jgi:hypothetical protein